MINFQLLRERAKYTRIDIILFGILYPISIIPSFTICKKNWISAPPTESSNNTFSFITDHLDVKALEPYTFRVMFPLIISLTHILIYLLTTWSLRFKIFIAYSKANESNATHVAFYPKPHRGSPAIVPFVKTTTPPHAIFQQKKLELIDGRFRSLRYPIELTFDEYLKSQGNKSQDITSKTEYYGLNIYQVPVPSFLQLLKEHMLAPLFVFQVVSIGCWMLDEYFYYPLFSLISLILVEANTVRTRQSNLLELRGVETTSYSIFAFRDNSWVFIQTSNLLPGDLILLEKEADAPADILLLSGRVVTNEAMLTGESTPQIKDSISTCDPNAKLNMKKDSKHIVFGRTKIEQIIPDEIPIRYLPRKGALGYVLSTGLGSSQGRLIRTILFATQRVAAESGDSLKLLLFLSIFAVAAAGYVIVKGLGSETISTFRIIVEAILIISQTIPPELPMELTFSVNASLLALSKLGVFCTEPFRIPFAGCTSTCCFDKTGTITKEDFELVGIDQTLIQAEQIIDEQANANQKKFGIKGNLILDVNKISKEALYVLGGCNSLIQGTKGLVGDSLEATAFTTCGFTFSSIGKSLIKHKRVNFTQIKAFHFSSDLRRMSVIIQDNSGSKKQYIVCKGAPESIAEHLANVPENYFETYRSYTKQGCRVLALAIKLLNGSTPASLLTREAAESSLEFCGFAIFSGGFKKGSEDTIATLLKSTHRCIMITGDDPLTACHIARQIRLINTDDPVIIDSREKYDQMFSKGNYGLGKQNLCFTGQALAEMDQQEYHNAIKNCNIFARMSPDNKAQVIITLKELGENVMMCGDGTNDVGALKAADVGVGLLEQSIETTIDSDEFQPKLGAASIAAPFVSKHSTISACVDLIRFGRATLSSTIDLFKELSLNSLVSAYSMSVLFVQNVKSGEQQMVLSSLGAMLTMLSISWAKPLRQLSPERPFESQFNMYLVTSVILQSITHLITFQLVHNLVVGTGWVPTPFDYKVKFSPSLMNTAMFLTNNEMQVATFVSNYRGRPFMQGFFENKLFFYSVLFSFVLVTLLTFDSNDILREIFQLVRFPSRQFQIKLSSYMIADLLLCLTFEKITLLFFTQKNKVAAKNLVSKETLDDLNNYEYKNDDVQPEENFKFGIKDMFKQNFELQKKMVLQRIMMKRKDKIQNMKMKKKNKK